MAFPKELAGYTSEEDFIQRLLIPLLKRLGFSVVNYHGRSEHGRDLIFAEMDRFGHVRYNGLQAKYVSSIGLEAIKEVIGYRSSEGLVRGDVQSSHHLDSGFSAEDLGIFLLRPIAAVVPVPRPSEDPGWDCVASLLRPEGSYQILPEDSFYVQIKARSVRKVQNKGEKARWFSDLQLPLFLASVDVKKAQIELYGFSQAMRLFAEGGPVPFTYFLGRPRTQGRDDGTEWIKLNQIFAWTIFDVRKPEFAQIAYDTLKPILQRERMNLELRKFGYYEHGPGSYSITGNSPPNRAFLEALTPHVRALGCCCASGRKEDEELITHLFSWMQKQGVDPDPRGVLARWIQMLQQKNKRDSGDVG